MPLAAYEMGLKELPSHDIGDINGIRASYKKFGAVVISKYYTPQQCRDKVAEMWHWVIQTQPWVGDHKLNVYDPETGAVLTLADNREKFLDIVMGPLSPKDLRYFTPRWTFHRGFGAASDDSVFHLPGVWETRQDPRLYGVASAILQEVELWVDCNRVINKLPGQGEDEFLHWDCNPMDPLNKNANKNLCGKSAYTQTTMRFVPGTHTKEFREEFCEKYADIYPNVKPNAPKFALNKDKADPMDLLKKRVDFVIPEGSMVFWHGQLLHGVCKRKERTIGYGHYHGYFPAGSRPEYKKVCGKREREDRVESYRDGKAPKLWPSFDKIQFYPLRFQNFPKILQGYIDKMDPNHPSITTRKTKSGQEVPHLTPWRGHAYVPPPLTPLGKQLLGLERWPEEQKKAEARGEKKRQKIAGFKTLISRKR
jgi:hypothetical protein